MFQESWVNPKLEVRPSSIGGRGVFAREPIAKGELLTTSCGRVIDTKTYYEEVTKYGWDSAFNIGPDKYLAPFDPANPSADWPVNHSCEPNAIQATDDNMVARRDIVAGEEVTHDYATTEEDPDWRMECNCGTPNCRKVITGNDWKIPEVQKKYRGFFTNSIQQKIDGDKETDKLGQAKEREIAAG
ncbi:MAG: SET domain-containing protein-lysine N-methyltransferase [Candidatus Sungbacteria bacterium]|nr:SET domain-containing protein-lysine N-methyltransferase [Candidatus Sungbacteria bacterium]